MTHETTSLAPLQGPDEAWPQVYQDIATLIGERSVNGQEAAKLLAEHFGGQQVYFPSLRQLRDKHIFEDWQAGHEVKDIARRHGLSVMRVRKLINQERRRRLPTLTEEGV